MSDLVHADIRIAEGADADKTISDVAAKIAAGALIPYIGPGCLADGEERLAIPATPEAVAFELNRLAPAPGRIRTNMWAVAQYIEQRRHRKSLIAAMAKIFDARVAPSLLHVALARLPIPLIVDTWYDNAMRTALADRSDWVEIQGITRALENSDIWFRSYQADGAPCDEAGLAGATTLLYKPHGGVAPAHNFLVADSDYVEVLTEIDIQTPLPPAVKRLRAGRGFAYIGCRFHDQMLRTYARQIAKGSEGPYYVFADPVELTKNELRFIASMNATLITAPTSALARALTA